MKRSISVMDTSLAGRVRYLRAQQGRSRCKVALAAGVTDGWLSAIEQGRITKPDPAKLRKLAAAIGTSYADLMDCAGYTESPPLPPDLRDFIVALQGLTPHQRTKILKMMYILMEPEQRPPMHLPVKWVS